jgi:hypothetical protein
MAAQLRLTHSGYRWQALHHFRTIARSFWRVSRLTHFLVRIPYPELDLIPNPERAQDYLPTSVAFVIYPE